jgi:DASS family divalent anion:Na+ symporter
MQKTLIKWLIVIGVGVVIASLPAPEGVTVGGWRLFAIFIATIVGSMIQPLPDSAVVLIGVVSSVLFGAMKPDVALRGYADPVVWLVLAAFFLSCGVIKTGLGRRIALMFMRAIGRSTLGLGYSLIATDFVLAAAVPSNSARNGGVLLPITLSISAEYNSHPDDGTAGRIGTFLINLLYQCDVIICATFLTGQAGNLVFAKLAAEHGGIQLTYLGWFVAAIVPSLISLAIVPLMIYRLFPPGIKATPEAAAFASEELNKLGGWPRSQKIMLGVLIAVILFWATFGHLHNVDVWIIGLLGVAVLLAARIIEWRDLMGDRTAWSVFIWYGGLVNMAAELGNTGLTKLFADRMSAVTGGMTWPIALAVLLFVYFYSHYFFASITAHVLAMSVPFLAVMLAAGAPTGLVVLMLAYFSNLNAGLTHYGTTPGPIYFGTGYVEQRTWWTTGLIASVINILVWSLFGLGWWRLLGWW